MVPVLYKWTVFSTDNVMRTDKDINTIKRKKGKKNVQKLSLFLFKIKSNDCLALQSKKSNQSATPCSPGASEPPDPVLSPLDRCTLGGQ